MVVVFFVDGVTVFSGMGVGGGIVLFIFSSWVTMHVLQDVKIQVSKSETIRLIRDGGRGYGGGEEGDGGFIPIATLSPPD